MSKKTTSKISNLFSKLIIAIYVYFRKKLSTVIRFISTPNIEERDYLKLSGQPKWKAVILVDKAIEHLQSAYGVSAYQTVSLYKIDSAYRLNNIYELIVLGVVKQGDYESEKPMSKCVQFEHEILSTDQKYHEIDKDLQWKDLARANSSNADQYWYVHDNIVEYKYQQYKTQRATKRIEDTIELTGIDSYLGNNLYSIDKIADLSEALRAINLMYSLRKYWFVLMYQDIPVEQLNEFALESCERALQKGEMGKIVFDEAKKRLEDMEDEKREKRNAARREHRAKAKAAKEEKSKIIVINYSKKAHVEKIKKQIAESEKREKEAAEKKPMKIAKSSTKPQANKAAPVKKLHPKKVSKRKTS